VKLKFKIQPYQTAAVDAVVDCFRGQPKSSGVSYRLDPGKVDTNQVLMAHADAFRNEDVRLTPREVLTNVQAVQQGQNLTVSSELVSSKVCPINLDIEMETGTGKTYCYIKSMFELNKRYG